MEPPTASGDWLGWVHTADNGQDNGLPAHRSQPYDFLSLSSTPIKSTSCRLEYFPNVTPVDINQVSQIVSSIFLTRFHHCTIITSQTAYLSFSPDVQSQSPYIILHIIPVRAPHVSDIF